MEAPWRSGYFWAGAGIVLIALAICGVFSVCVATSDDFTRCAIVSDALKCQQHYDQTQ